MKQLFALPINLQQILIHTNEPDVSNSVVAFFDRHNKQLVIRGIYQTRASRIKQFCSENIQDFDFFDIEIRYDSGFEVTTWNAKIKS